MGGTAKDERTLEGREILLCLTGGIACYKSADLASSLVRRGAGLTVAMTAAARKFVGPVTFRSLTGRRVYCDLWEDAEGTAVRHLSLTERAELMIVAPATANILAKMACGIADDLVSTLALSAAGACPILAAPAMNSRMWHAPATAENVATLEKRGVTMVGPADGWLACGMSGTGRMAEPADILKTAYDMLS